MFCPNCRDEFVEGVEICTVCGAVLVRELPPLEVENGKPASVFEAADPGEALLARSLLESVGLEFIVKNEGVQDLFGLGSMGGYNLLVGPVTFLVRPEDAEAAVELLRPLIEAREERKWREHSGMEVSEPSFEDGEGER